MNVESESSMIKRFEHDPETSVLKVTFRTGKTYTYKNVPEAVAAEFESAPSHGRFFNENIKGQYE